MKTLSADTRPETERVMIDLIRRAPPWRKVALLDQVTQTLRIWALSGLRLRHPHAAPEFLRRRLADLWLGPELAAKVYGPLVPQEPDHADRADIR